MKTIKDFSFKILKKKKKSDHLKFANHNSQFTNTNHNYKIKIKIYTINQKKSKLLKKIKSEKKIQSFELCV